MRNLTETEKINLSAKHQSSMDLLQFIPGIWVNGKCFWLQNQSEKVIYDEALVIKVKLEQIHSKIRFSNIYVRNHGSQMKEVKLLGMHFPLNVNQNNLSFISPVESKIFHYIDERVFLVNGKCHGSGLKEYTAIPLWSAFTDRIWSSLETGNLMYQPMSKGLSASIISMKVNVQPRETKKMSTWSIMGTRKSELVSLEQGLLKNILAFPKEK